MDYDAIVIGAGPAGSSLALTLARAGRSVLLADGATFPRAKVCGEGIMPAGVAHLEALGLGEFLNAESWPFQGIRYRLADGTRAEAQFPDGLVGRAVERTALDARLVEEARREPNVDVELGTWVREVQRTADGAAARLGARWVRAPVVVGADGGRSFVRRTAGLDAALPRRQRFGVGAHFEHEPSGDPWSAVEVFVGRDHELYTTLVRPGLTCVALLLEREALGPLQGRLEDGLRERLEAAGGRCGALAQGALWGAARALGPLGLGARAAHADRLLLVGDAAGALDPITGEGVALALTTSQLAAEVLLGCYADGDFSARRLATFTRRRRRALRGLAWLTQGVLRLAAHPALAARVVRNLSRCPDSFRRLLGVAAGVAPLSSLSLRDGVRVLVGV